MKSVSTTMTAVDTRSINSCVRANSEADGAFFEPRDGRDEDLDDGFEDGLDEDEVLALADRAGFEDLDFAFAEGLAIGDTVGFMILVDGHWKAPLPHINAAYISTGDDKMRITMRRSLLSLS